MASRTKTVLWALLVGLTLGLVAVFAGVVPLYLGWLEPTIAASVRDATALELDVGGPLVARLGPRAGVRASRLALATPSGGPIVTLDDADVRISLLALLRGRLHVRNATVSGVRAELCLSLPERPPASNDSTSEPPVVIVDAVEVTALDFVCAGEPTELSVDRVAGTAPDGGPIELEASAELAGIPARVTASGGRLEQLLKREAFAFDAAVDMQAVSASAKGEFAWDAGSPVVATRLFLQAANLRALGKAFDADVPDIGALAIDAAVQAGTARIDILELAGELGDTGFSATGAIALQGERPYIELSAELPLLDLSPYMPEASSSSTGPADFTSFFDALKRFDAGVKASIDEVSGLPLRIRDAALEASLVDGFVDLASANAAVLDGQLVLTGTLDAGSACPQLDVVTELDSIALSEFRDAGWLEAAVEGRVSAARITSRSCGTSLSAHLDQLSATATAVGGRIVVADDLPIDIAEVTMAFEAHEPIRLTASAVLAGEPLEIDVKTGALQAIASRDPWPLSLLATADGSELRVEGAARIGSGPPAFDVSARFSAARVGALHAWFAVAPDAPHSLLASTRLRLDAARFVADEIEIELDGSDLKGSFTWPHAATPDTAAIALRSGFIDLDKIRQSFAAVGLPGAGGANEPGDWRGLPPIDLDLAFGAIRGGRLDVTDLEIKGRMREGLIDNAVLSAIVEDELSLTGQLDVDVRELPATLVLDAGADNADIGRLLGRLELVDDLSMRVDALALTVGGQGDSVATWLKNLQVDATLQNFAWDIPRPRSDREFKVRLDTLSVLLQPGEPLAASTSGIVDGVPFELWIETPGLGAVLGDAPELPLRLVAAAEDDAVMIDLLLERSSEQQVSGRVAVSGQAIDERGRDLAALESPLADYALTGDLLVSEVEVTLSDIEAHLGGSKASGSASLSGYGRQRLEVELSSPLLQANDLTYLPGFGRSVGTTASAGVPRSADIAEPTESPPARKGPLLVMRELIERYQQQYDLDVAVAIDELYAGQDLIGGVDVQLFVNEREFRLRPVTIRLPGGRLDAEYGWRNDDGRVSAGLFVHADRLVYGGLSKLVDPSLDARGFLYFDIELEAENDWSPHRSEFDLLLANANGAIDVAVWPENFDAGVLDLWTANLVFALLPVPSGGETSRLNCVAARLEANDGLLKPGNVLMDTTTSIIRGRGKIDLDQRELDLLVTPQAKRERFLSASTPIKVTGPLNSPEIGVEPAGFLGTLIRWYTNLIYVPYKWLTGQRFPVDGTQTCFDVMDWELTPGLEAYFRERDFSVPPQVD